MAELGRRWIIVNIQNSRATQEQTLQFMTTEHFTLQTARSATIAESNGRSAASGSGGSGITTSNWPPRSAATSSTRLMTTRSMHWRV
jgi:hypothetical protein